MYKPLNPFETLRMHTLQGLSFRLSLPENVKNNSDVVLSISLLYNWHCIIYLSICLCLLLFCFEFCQLYRILCDAEIKMADLMTLKY